MDKKKKRSFIKRIRFMQLMFLLLFAGILISSNIFYKINRFEGKVAIVKKEYIEEQKRIVKMQVQQIVSLVNCKKEEVSKVSKKILKKRVYEAYSIINNIYINNKDKPKKTITKMIHDALSPIRFGENNGYYFINNSSGKVLLYPTKPNLENSNIRNIQDSKGNYPVKMQREIIEKSGEGFTIAYWEKPNSVLKNKDYKKITFVKKFEPYNWTIGAGVYIVDIEAMQKRNIINEISNIKLEKGISLFMGQWDGMTLIGPGKGKNHYKIVDKNGVMVVKELIQKAKNGGGFVSYRMPNVNNKVNKKKISYSQQIKDWKWYIGAGVYLDDLTDKIAKLESRLRDAIITEMIAILGVTILFAFVLILIFNYITVKAGKDYSLFNTFFKKAAYMNEQIDRDNIQFTELDEIAANANKMLFDKFEAKEKLRKEKEQLFVTIKSIGDGVITTDSNGKIMLLNNVAEKLTGWISSEAKGVDLEKVFNIINASTRNKVENPVGRVLQSGEIVGLANHTILVSKDKTEYQIADSAAPIKGVFGEIEGVVLVFRDVTGEYFLQNKIIENEKNYRLITESTSDFIGKIDLNGKYTYVSPSHKLLGYSQEDLIGKAGLDFIHPEDSAKLPELMEEAIANPTKEIKVQEYRFKDKWGKWHNLHCNFNFIFDSKGLPESILIISRDITKRKRAEEELLKMHKLQSVGVLAGGIAHDFNNILTGVFGNISLVKINMKPEDKSYKYLEKAEQSMSRAIKLTKQLLTFSKGGAPVKESINILELIKEVVSFDLSGSNVKPIFKESNGLWNVFADKGQIEQVFSNLAINANQAMDNGGKLFIDIKNVFISSNEIIGLKEGKFIEIKVRDEGNGISKENLRKIFDPYFTTKKEGNGLGLATSYSIISKHDGHISVKSDLGKGTEFTIYLPASENRDIAEVKQNGEDSEDMEKNANILVMDDEAIIREVVSEMIQEIGFSVQTVKDGNEVVSLYKETFGTDKHFDVVIMDLTIPGGMGGEEAIKYLLEINPNIIGIVSSGYSSGEQISKYKELGFRATLEKPYTVSQLKKVLEKVLKMV